MGMKRSTATRRWRALARAPEVGGARLSRFNIARRLSSSGEDEQAFNSLEALNPDAAYTLSVDLSLRQRDIAGNKKRGYSICSTITVQPGDKDDSGAPTSAPVVTVADVPWPSLNPDGGGYRVPSPSGRYIMCWQETTDSSGRKTVRIEIFNGGSIIFSIDCSAYHGRIFTDDNFGGIEWDETEKRIVYIAETLDIKRKGYFDVEARSSGTVKVIDSTTNAAIEESGPTGLSNKFPAREHWGETLSDWARPSVFILQLGDLDEVYCEDALLNEAKERPPGSLIGGEGCEIYRLEGLPTSIDPGQAQWTPGGNILLNGYMTEPRRFGVKFCYNRPSGLFLATVGFGDHTETEVSEEVYSSTKARGLPLRRLHNLNGMLLEKMTTLDKYYANGGVRSPRFTPDGSTLVYIYSPIYPAHHGCCAIIKVKWPSNQEENDLACPEHYVGAGNMDCCVAVEIVDEPSPDAFPNAPGFAGIFMGNFAPNPFTADGTFLIFNTYCRSLNRLCALDMTVWPDTSQPSTDWPDTPELVRSKPRGRTVSSASEIADPSRDILNAIQGLQKIRGALLPDLREEQKAELREGLRWLDEGSQSHGAVRIMDVLEDVYIALATSPTDPGLVIIGDIWSLLGYSVTRGDGVKGRTQAQVATDRAGVRTAVLFHSLSQWIPSQEKMNLASLSWEIHTLEVTRDYVYVPCDVIGATTPPAASVAESSTEARRVIDPALAYQRRFGLGSKEVQAIHVKPRDRPAVGLIVMPHGGPHSAFVNEFMLGPAYFADMGFAVTLVNYRGSTGFGQGSISSLLGQIGVLDVKDCLAATQHAMQTEKFAEGCSANVYYFSGSHGGFIGAHLGAHFPTLFRASVLRNPVTNIASMQATSDIPDWCIGEAGMVYSQYLTATFGEEANSASSVKTTAERLMSLWKCSPLQYASKIECRTIIMIGENDKRVPPSQGLSYYHALKEHNKDVQLRVYPKNGHALNSPEAEGDAAVTAVLLFLESAEDPVQIQAMLQR
eukprot:Clim_evm108s147 gene=Clim_evmTU108s147